MAKNLLQSNSEHKPQITRANLRELKKIQEGILKDIENFCDKEKVQKELNRLKNKINGSLDPDINKKIAILSDSIKLDNYIRILHDKHQFISNFIQLKKGSFSENDIIYYAIEKNNIDVLNFLFKGKGYKHNFVNEQGTNYLQHAAANANKKTIKYLLDNYKYDIEHEDMYGNTALSYSANNADSDVTKFLVDNYKASIDNSKGFGQGILYKAIKYNKIESIKTLLNKFTTDDLFERTASSLGGHRDSVSVFIDKDSRADEKTIAIVLNAIIRGEIKNNLGKCFYKLMDDIHKTCLSHKYDELLKESELYVINQAIKEQDIEQIRKCHNLGYDFTITNSKSRESLLDEANKYGNIDNLLNDFPSSTSFLHKAAKYGNVEIIDFLINVCHLDVNLDKKNEQTPLEIAVTEDNSEVAIHLIKNCGAKIKIYDKSDTNNLVFHASEHNDFELIQTIVNKGETHTNHFLDYGDGVSAFSVMGGKRASTKLMKFLLNAVESGVIKSDLDTESKTSYKYFLTDILNGALLYKNIEIIKIIKEKIQQAKISIDQGSIVYEDEFKKYYIDEETLSEDEYSEELSEDEYFEELSEDEESEEKLEEDQKIYPQKLAFGGGEANSAGINNDQDEVNALGNQIYNIDTGND